MQSGIVATLNILDDGQEDKSCRHICACMQCLTWSLMDGARAGTVESLHGIPFKALSDEQCTELEVHSCMFAMFNVFSDRQGAKAKRALEQMLHSLI